MASKSLPRRITELREQIKHLRTERNQLPGALLPKADAIRAAHQWVDELAAQFNAPYRATEFAQIGGTRKLLTISAIGKGELTKDVELAPMLAWLMGDELKAKLASALDGLEEDGIPAADRPELMARLDADIRALEIAEEQLIRESESAGEPIQRRTDAEPELVLAPDDALAA